MNGIDSGKDTTLVAQYKDTPNTKTQRVAKKLQRLSMQKKELTVKLYIIIFLRPIVDYTRSIGYNAPRSLAHLLAPIVGKISHHIKNSKYLVNEMVSIMIEQDEMFLSHDVVSLFTNTPINETLDIIKKHLEADTKLELRTNLSMDDMKFIVTTTYVCFMDTIYQPKFGTAVGSPVSSVIANLFMEWLEQQAILTTLITCKPKLWKRYVDEVMEVVKKGCEQDQTELLYSIYTRGSIKFTYEDESDNSLPFLDTLMIRKEDGTVEFLVYRKKMHTDQYLSFTSHHPFNQKLGGHKNVTV